MGLKQQEAEKLSQILQQQQQQAQLGAAVTSTAGGASNAGLLVKLDASGKIDGHAMPSGSGDVVTTDATQTLTGKTLTTPVINGLTAASGNADFSGSNGTIKFPTGGAGANLPMNSKILTGLAAGAAAGDSLRYEQGGLPFYCSNTGVTGNNVTRYLDPKAAGVNAAAQVIGVVTRTGILRNLRAMLGTAPGGSDTVVFTVYKSSDQGATFTATTLTCTITGAAVTASDTTHFPAVTAGDLLAIQTVSSAGTAATPSAGFELL